MQGIRIVLLAAVFAGCSSNGESGIVGDGDNDGDQVDPDVHTETEADEDGCSGLSAGSPRLVRETLIDTGCGTPVEMAWTGTEFGIVWWGDSDPHYFSRVSARGEVVGEKQRIPEVCDWPVIGDLVWTGSAHTAVWTCIGSGDDHQVRTSRIEWDGTSDAAGTAIAVSSDPDMSPRMAWTGSEIGLVWQQEAVDSDPSSVDGAFLAILSDEGDTVVDPVMLETLYGYPDEPQIVWSGSEFGVAWKGWDVDALGNRIFFCRHAARGVRMSAAVSIDADWSPIGSPPCRLGWTGSEFSVVWQEYDAVSALSVGTHLTSVSAEGEITGDRLLDLAWNDMHDVTPATWTGNGFGLVGRDSGEEPINLYLATIDPTGATLASGVVIAPGVEAHTAATYPMLEIAWTGSSLGVPWVDAWGASHMRQYELHFSLFEICL